MKITKNKLCSVIKSCLKQISFKDKGLIVIMIILLLQGVYNLYTEVPKYDDYVSINIIIRTSIASIFGYFLSSNFLKKINDDKIDNSTDIKLEILEEILKNEKSKEYIEGQNNLIKSIESDEKEIEEKYLCNTNLQNAMAIGISIAILICLIIGINFELIKEGSTVTIAQFRDLISGSIGFLLGSNTK